MIVAHFAFHQAGESPTFETLMISRRFLLFCLPVFFIATAFTATAPAAGPKKILFIGNSYTGGIKGMVTKLIQQSPHPETELTFIHPGGKTLEFHLKNEATIEKIKTGDFDFVVLQDQSQFPAVFPDRFHKAARALDKIIDQSGAQTVFYQTWGRRDGDTRNREAFPTFEAMQKALSKSYRTAARRCAATLAPVGETWAAVRQAAPELGRDLYRQDGSHPSSKGAYLAACVFYRTFFKEDPAMIAFTGGLSKTEAKIIQQAAVAQTQ